MLRKAITACTICLALSACTQLQGNLPRACDIRSITLNTGLDHLNTTPFDPQLYELGASDEKWLVIDAPQGVTVPRQATAITSADWVTPSSTSRWVGPYPEGTTEPSELPHGEYVFLHCFCLCDNPEDFTALQGTLRATGGGTVEINGQVVAGIPTGGNASAERPEVEFAATHESALEPGINCLKVTTNVEVIVGPGSLPRTLGINVNGLVRTVACCEGEVSGVPESLELPQLTPDRSVLEKQLRVQKN